ncbi:HNH endonuclease [bacterium LRH843]|nr:HNH endonuclease [bacterium LRH843]
MAIPNNITRHHVLEALRKMDHIGMISLRQSTKFELFFAGKVYPPKEVIRFANEIANGYELRAFGGGDESNNFLINLGFDIVLKGTTTVIALNYTKNKGIDREKSQKLTELTQKPVINDIPILSEGEVEQSNITVTEREQLIKARIGQSEFKKGLVKIECKCKLCGVEDESFLIASHIKPWSRSSHEERLDLNNGLLLCPNHDALFDKGYISFNTEGTILISDLVSYETRLFLNISDQLQVELKEGQMKYIAWHRENLFKDLVE